MSVFGIFGLEVENLALNFGPNMPYWIFLAKIILLGRKWDFNFRKILLYLISIT